MSKQNVQVYRNISLLPGRHVPISAPHFAVSYLDERNVFANIVAMTAASSPTRGLFYSTMLPGSTETSRTVFEVLRKPMNLTRSQIASSEKIGTEGYANRYVKILKGLLDLAKPRKDGENPLAIYMSTLKHSDLFADPDVNSKDTFRGMLPASILGLVHEQSYTVVDYPIGAAVLDMFAAYVENPQVMTDKTKMEGDTAGFAQSTESQYGKFRGKIIKAVSFGADDLTIPDPVREFSVYPSVLLTDLFSEGPLVDQITADEAGFTRSLIALDVLNNLDKIAAYLRNLSPALMSVKPEEKIAAVRAVYALVSSILFQPVLMYGHLIVGILNNPVVKKHISARLPHLYDSTVFKEVLESISNKPLSPIYAEVVRHYNISKVDTTFGETEIITVPKGLLNFLPFLQGPGKAVQSIKDKNKKTESIKSTFQDLTLLTAGPGLFSGDLITNRKEMELTDFIGQLRTINHVYFENAPETIADMTKISSALGYKLPTTQSIVDRANPEVIITDGLISSTKMDYDKVVHSIIMKPKDLLSSSPNKRVIIPTTSGMEEVTPLIQQFYEFKDLLIGANTSRESIIEQDQMIDSGVVPLLVRQDPWFERFSINANLLLNGRLPMSRYMLDGDAMIIQHSTFANFASDLGMDPATLGLYLKGAKDSDSLIGREVAALLLEFFTDVKENTKSNIPDADEWGIGDRSFRYSIYFTSSRAASYHLYAEVVVNQLLPPVQFIQYLEWSRTGHITLPICRPLFIDKAFQSSMLSGEGVASSFGSDIIERLR